MRWRFGAATLVNGRRHGTKRAAVVRRFGRKAACPLARPSDGLLRCCKRANDADERRNLHKREADHKRGRHRRRNSEGPNSSCPPHDLAGAPRPQGLLPAAAWGWKPRSSIMRSSVDAVVVSQPELRGVEGIDGFMGGERFLPSAQRAWERQGRTEPRRPQSR
jgi:hypothetical protein